MKKFLYTYDLIGNPPHTQPVSVLDNGTRTRFVNMPVVQDCGETNYLKDPCQGFNYHLCGIDSPFFQPICVAEKNIDCDNPKGYAKITFLYKRLKTDKANLILNLTTEGNPYIGTYLSYDPNLPDIKGFYLPIIDNYSSEPDEILHGNRFANSLKATGFYYTQYLGNDYYEMFIHIETVLQVYGIDICREKLLLLGPENYIYAEVRQPLCCELETQVSCPVEKGFIGIPFEATVQNTDEYSFTISFEEIGCDNINQPHVFYHRFRGRQNGNFTQQQFENHLLANFSNRQGYKIERVGDGKFVLLISTAYLMFGFDWSRIPGYFNNPCLLTPTLCSATTGIRVTVNNNLLCCSRQAINDCKTLPNFIQYSYTIQPANYNLPINDPTAFGGLFLHIPFITDGGSGLAKDVSNFFNLSIRHGQTLADYLNFVETQWNELFYNHYPGLGFVRRLGNRFDIFIDRFKYKNILLSKNVRVDECDIHAFLFQIDFIYPQQVVPPFRRTVDLQYSVHYTEAEPYMNEYIDVIFGRQVTVRMIGESFPPYCCHNEITLPKCCPCSENNLCNIIGLLNKTLQEYILSSTNLYPTDAYPKATGIAFLDELKRFKPEIFHIPYENDCYYLQFIVKEERNTDATSADDTVMIQIALYPKMNCNHSYIAAVFVSMRNNSLLVNATLSKSRKPGALIPEKFHAFENDKWRRPTHYEDASYGCPEDPRCQEDTPDYEPQCEECINACSTTDLLYFQFRMPDYFNDWSAISSGPLRENIDYGWIDPLERKKPGAKWLASVEVISEENVSYRFDQIVHKSFVGLLEEGQFLQQIIINPTSLPDNFYFRFIFNTPKGEIYVYTEPYEKVNCIDTVIIEGIYPATGKASFDCMNNSYAYPKKYIGDNFRNRLVLRVPGVVNFDNFEISTTQVNNRTINVKTESKYKLRTAPLPPYMVDKIKTIFESQVILINGDEYKFEGAVNRNNNDGSMWLLEANLIRVDRSCSPINFSCLS